MNEQPDTGPSAPARTQASSGTSRSDPSVRAAASPEPTPDPDSFLVPEWLTYHSPGVEHSGVNAGKPMETQVAAASTQGQATDDSVATSDAQEAPALPDLAVLEAAATATPDAAAPARHGIARLIEYASDRYVAFAPHTTIELVENPSLVEVPGAASYALGLMRWQDDWLPVIDLAWLLHGKPQSLAASPRPRYALVLAYQPAPRQPLAHGAIALDLLPQFAAVSDTQQCPWPAAHPRWPQLGLSCFAHEGHAVPIIDTGRLFAGYHIPWAAQN